MRTQAHFLLAGLVVMGAATARAAVSAPRPAATTAPAAITWIARVEAEMAGLGRNDVGPHPTQLIRLWARAGDDAAARRIMAQARGRSESFLAVLAEEQARRGEVELALQTAGAVTDPDKIDLVLLPMAQRRAAVGDFAGAKAVADRFTRAGWQESRYEAIFTEGTKARGVATAQATAQALSDVSCRLAAYRGIAKAQALGGDEVGALKTIALLNDGRPDIWRRAVGNWRLAGPFVDLATMPCADLLPTARNHEAEDDVRQIPEVMGLLVPALKKGANQAAVARALAAARERAAASGKGDDALAYTYVALTQAQLGDKAGAKVTAEKVMALLGEGYDGAGCVPRLAALVTRLHGVEVAGALVAGLKPRDRRDALVVIGYAALENGRAGELEAFVGRQAAAGDRGLLLCGAAWAALEKSEAKR